MGLSAVPFLRVSSRVCLQAAALVERYVHHPVVADLPEQVPRGRRVFRVLAACRNNVNILYPRSQAPLF